MEKYLAIEIDHSFSDGQWANYWELIRTIQAVKNEPSIFAAWQELKRSRVEAADQTLREMIISNGSGLVGRMRMLRRSEDFIDVEIEMSSAEPPASLMNYTAQLLLKSMNELGLEKVNYKTTNETLSEFSKSIGARMVNHFLYYHLDCTKANREQISKWLIEFPAKNSAAELQIFKGVPDEHIDEYADIFIELLSDMPRDASLPPQAGYTTEDVKRDLGMNKGSREIWVGLLLEENKVIGMTNLAIHNNNFDHVFQYMTGVKKEHRGRGLARWMKAAMFDHLLTLDQQPKMIYTSTYSLNVPMQNINFAMGYELKKEGFEYMLLREELERKLQGMSAAI